MPRAWPSKILVIALTTIGTCFLASGAILVLALTMLAGLDLAGIMEFH
jgi:hypothetical protein